MTVVGEASLLIRADTSMLAADVTTQSEAALAGVSASSQLAGAEAGANLRKGVEGETSLLAAGVGADAQKAGHALEDGLSVGGTAAKDLGKTVEGETSKMKMAFNDLGNKASSSLQGIGVPKFLTTGPSVVALLGAAVGAFSIKMASDLQTADASIVASEGITTKAAQNIGSAFDSTAFKSEYSGIAQATAFAAVAGQLKATQGQALSTQQSLEFMNATTDLATAKGIQLGDATSTTAGILQAFQLPVDQASKATNILFNASNDTGQSMDTFATSVEKLKAKLGSAAPDLQNLAALSVDLTKQGITGRAAVSGMNTAITSLGAAAAGTTKTGKDAETTLKLYGLSARTSTGELTPLSTIIGGLGPKFKTMTQSQQIATASAIFGASAAKQMTAVILAGSAAFDQATAAVTKNNAVQDAAAVKQKTLAGEVDILKAGITSEATQLGGVLVPALTTVVGAIAPVIGDFTSLVKWFEQGSTPALTIAAIIGGVLAPALIRMGIDAVTSATKAVVGFVTMSSSASANAAKTEASLAGQDAAVAASGTTVVTTATEVETALGEEQLAFEGLGTTVSEVAGVVETETVAMGASFTAMAGVAAAGLASFVLTLKGLDALRNHLTVKPSTHDVGAAANLQNLEQQAGITDAGTGVLGQKTVDYLLSEQKKKKAESAAAAAAKFKVDFPTIKVPDAYIPPVTGTSSSTKQTSAQKEAKAKAAALAKEEAAALRAENSLATEISKAVTMPAEKGANYLKQLGVPANKAAAVLHDAVEPFNQAVTALEKAGFDASNAVKIATAGTNATQKADAAAAKAQNLLASEVSSAVGKPLAEAKDALHALGVPINEASSLLKDAVLPFNQAVTALEKAGFDAANAVKIAEAGTATALKGAVADSTNATGLLVNGIEVSGKVYDAAIGQAFKQQTHETMKHIAATKGKVTPESYGAIGGPRSSTVKPTQQINIQSGAVVIHPAPGNDANSQLATKSMVEEAFRKLAVVLSGGVSQMGNVFG